MPTRREIDFIQMHDAVGDNGHGEIEAHTCSGWVCQHKGARRRGGVGGWERAGLLVSGHRVHVLTPRGHDLIRTARVAGIPDRADDEPALPDDAAPTMVTCPTCKGRRRVDHLGPRRDRTIVELVDGEQAREAVTLSGWDYTCPKCAGRGEVDPAMSGSRELAARAVACKHWRWLPAVKTAALPGMSALPQTHGHAGCGGWVTLTKDNAETFVGRRIEFIGLSGKPK